MLAVAGEDYVVCAADTRMSTGYNILTRDYKKIDQMSDKCVLGQSGKPLVVKFAEGMHQVSLPPAGGGIWMAGWVGLAGRQGLGARP